MQTREAETAKDEITGTGTITLSPDSITGTGTISDRRFFREILRSFTASDAVRTAIVFMTRAFAPAHYVFGSQFKMAKKGGKTRDKNSTWDGFNLGETITGTGTIYFLFKFCRSGHFRL